MSQPLTFQQVIMTLHQFWADQGCALWQPHNLQVGAGTNNPATLLRVLGPEPWRVAYAEPSVRPDDGRYGENPNRMQYYYQYQVILKPDPGNPQELYLRSLAALGIDARQHDIRFVEDNWESPGLGAWGLGWEVWLDGQEITQFTYFQQAGGLELDPVSVEITYGLERIVLALQGKNTAWDIAWLGGDDVTAPLAYRDLLLRSEWEHCTYYFELADVEGLRRVYDIYEGEYRRALAAGALAPAYDYVLKCNHLFNVLDTRGAIGVTERAKYFRRMRDMTREVAKAYVAQREAAGHPLSKMADRWARPSEPVRVPVADLGSAPDEPADLLFEIGVEELPAADVDAALAQLREAAPRLLDGLRLTTDIITCYATPRRLVVTARGVSPRQPDAERVEKGPPAERAFDAEGKPTKAAEGFARGRGVPVEALTVAEIDGGRYVTARVAEVGRPAAEVLAEALPSLVAGLRFGRTMRWNHTNVAFARPVRWLVALLGETLLPCHYAGVHSGTTTRGLRPYDSPDLPVRHLDDYLAQMVSQGILLAREARRAAILESTRLLAAEIDGRVPPDDALLDEVVNLVEAPTALRGAFEAITLELPRDVLITVMRDKQRYFPVEDGAGALLPAFITIRNGDDQHLVLVRHGNEQVLRARFADAQFFFAEDSKKRLEDFLPRLVTLTFHESVGSMLEKNERVAGLVSAVGDALALGGDDIAVAQSAAHIAKADLAAQVVVEMTSLQGAMGRVYALRQGYPQAVADAVAEHWLPRFAGDALPASVPGALLAITDRLDTLVGLFGAGLAPRGSADPFGLRRAALGLVQLWVGRALDADLRTVVALVARAQPISVDEAAQATLLDFIRGRLEAWMLDELALPHDGVQAVLTEQATRPYRAVQGARELAVWVAHPDWTPLLDGYARCVRIVRGESQTTPVDPARFTQPEERALYDALTRAEATLPPAANVDGFLAAFAPMLPAVTAFFDEVLVNTDDVALRANRLSLLQRVRALGAGRADLSLLSGF